MAASEEASNLHKIWNIEELGKYQGLWIAFRVGEEIQSAENASVLMEQFQVEFRERRGPILAYVDFEPRQ